VDRFEDYLADLDAFAARIRAEAAGRKVFLVAHSQGGHIAAHWALRGGRSVDGVVLSNPYFRLAIDPPKVKIWTALLVGKIVPHLPVDAGLDLATLTSDPEMQAWSDADPLYQRKATPRWFTESGRAQADLRKDMAGFDRPLLLLLGTGDRIADGAAATEFFAAVGSRDKTTKEYVGFEHEIFNERGRAAPIADAVDWISGRSAPGTH
jgi:alpha-beta hydrolase superfamily lysophospholipase